MYVFKYIYSIPATKLFRLPHHSAHYCQWPPSFCMFKSRSCPLQYRVRNDCHNGYFYYCVCGRNNNNGTPIVKRWRLMFKSYINDNNRSIHYRYKPFVYKLYTNGYVIYYNIIR